MFTVVRANMDFMGEVRACINSNYEMYAPIVDPQDLGEHRVDETWAEKNYRIREFFVARAGGQTVGTASFQKLGTFAYIGYFYIKSPFHGKGYGRALMNFMEMYAKTREITDLRLFTNAKATWALEFYQKMGFSIITTEKEEILSLEGGILQPFYEQNSYLLSKQIK